MYRSLHQFQSAPPAEARGDTSRHLRRSRPLNVVSIRSPCRSKGRSGPRANTRRNRLDMAFQSAPPAEARGDRARSDTESPGLWALFQSAPPAEARGDRPTATGLQGQVAAGDSVSIRSPCRSKGRLSRACHGARLEASQFQSAPPAEARGDAGGMVPVGGLPRYLFQSAPPAEARGDRIRRVGNQSR